MAKIKHFLFLFIASIYFSDNKNILLHIKLIPCINETIAQYGTRCVIFDIQAHYACHRHDTPAKPRV